MKNPGVGKVTTIYKVGTGNTKVLNRALTKLKC
jgi:hypothetical protein